ncbi:MAG: hypothetical protein RLZZ227_1755 [Pseudomonadota bacterium]|jgi:hypothetical protein
MKNPDHVVTVDVSKHAKTRVKPNVDFGHAKELNVAAVMLGELTAVVANFPVVFVEHPETKVTRPVAMFGLRPGENFFYGADGWDSTYVPLLIQRHPFIIGLNDKDPDSKMLAMCLDRNSPYLSETDGIALFKENGEGTEYLASRDMLLTEIFEGEKITDQFTKKMKELGLLAPFELVLQAMDGEMRKVTGMQTLSERKLQELTPEQAHELRLSGFLPACYLIFSSLFQIHKLMQLRNRKSPDQLNYRIELDPQPQVVTQ